MGPRLCLYTASPEPSGLGEHMLVLLTELRDRYRITLVAPPGTSGERLLGQGRALGVESLALDEGDALRDWLRAVGTDLFHCHAGISWEGHTAIHLARAAGVRRIARTEHLPFVDESCDGRRGYLDLLDSIDQVIGVSEGVAESFRQAGAPSAKVRTIRNGINPHPPASVATRTAVRTSLGLPTDARIVLTVGRLTEQKSPFVLLEAASAVLARAPSTYFVWIGSGPLEGALREWLAVRSLSRYIHFLGRRPDVSELLSAADLFALPSRFEGLPLALLEAMRAGLATIGARVCGIDEVIRDGETGRLVPFGDAVALANAIVEALACPALAARWGAAGQKVVQEEFNAARMARETDAVYEELLGLPVATRG